MGGKETKDGDGDSTNDSAADSTEAPPRVERVVIFIPDVWSCVPDQAAFEASQAALNAQRDAKLAALEPPPPSPKTAEDSETKDADEKEATAAEEATADDSTADEVLLILL